MKGNHFNQQNRQQTEPTNRRQFLKALSLGLGATTLASSVSSVAGNITQPETIKEETKERSKGYRETQDVINYYNSL